MSKGARLLHGPSRTTDASNRSFSENIQLLGCMAKVRLYLTPKRKKMFCRVELPVLCVLAKATLGNYIL